MPLVFGNERAPHVPRHALCLHQVVIPEGQRFLGGELVLPRERIDQLARLLHHERHRGRKTGTFERIAPDGEDAAEARFGDHHHLCVPECLGNHRVGAPGEWAQGRCAGPAFGQGYRGVPIEAKAGEDGVGKRRKRRCFHPRIAFITRGADVRAQSRPGPGKAGSGSGGASGMHAEKEKDVTRHGT